MLHVPGSQELALLHIHDAPGLCRRDQQVRLAAEEGGRLEEVGDLGDGLTTEVWWTPSHPFSSSLTRQSAKQLAASYETATKKQWTQPIGFSEALFEAIERHLMRRTIAERVAQGHIHLQETLCDDVLARMLAHPKVRAARVSTEKPDVYPDCDAVGCEVFGLKDPA